MKKIKNFKINLRMREIIRLLKTTTRIAEITPQLEEAIARESSRLREIFRPAAIYESDPKEKFPAELAATPPGQWVAASVFVATIGSGVEEEIREAQQRGEDILSQVLHAIALEALEQSGNFIQRLIHDEAREEECELSRQQRLDLPECFPRLSELAPPEKIGVQTLHGGSIKPLYSSAGVVYWIPLKKAKTAKNH